MNWKQLWSLGASLALSMGAWAQVSVVKTATPNGSVAPGDTINYVITLTNSSGSNLAITSFFDSIPENATYLSGTLTLDPFVDQSLWYFQGEIYNSGDLFLPANGTTTITYSATVDSGTSPGALIQNVAETNFGDSNITTNSVIAGSEVFSFLDVDPPGVATPGELLTYSITFLNYGFAPATLQIQSPVPDFTTFEVGSVVLTGVTGNFAYNGSNAIVTDGSGLTLPARASATVSYKMRVLNALPDDVQISHSATINGVASNTVANFTATLSDYVDMTNVPGNVVVNDTVRADSTGFSMAGGDFDNDGKGDLIIAEPFGHDETTRSGVVHIVYGGLGLSSNVTLPNGGGGVDTQIYPPQGTRSFGLSVAAGDVTGDGIDDIIIGAPGLGTTSQAGQVFVVAGGHFQNVIDFASTDTPRTVINGIDGIFLGWGVATGDVNGDGVGDIVMTAPNFAVSGTIRGLVTVMPGGPFLPATIALGSPPGGTSNVLGDGGDFGICNTPHSVAVGDINGDHRADLILGAPNAPTSWGAQRGKVYVVRGTQHPFSVDLSGAPAGFTEYQGIYGGSGQDGSNLYFGGAMGWSVCAGDFNGDGFDDIGAGAPFATWYLIPANIEFTGAGVAFQFFGSSALADGEIDINTIASRTTTIFGSERGFFDSGGNVIIPGDELGYGVAAGDHNGDGFDDFLMGSPGIRSFDGARDGGAIALLGSGFLNPQYLLPFAPTQILFFAADSGSQAAGNNVAFGDMNTDGFGDIFINDMVYSFSFADGDEIHVFFGKPRAPRLIFATASEFGDTDLVLQPGEQLILQFDQPVTVTPTALEPGDFFLTDPGASLGAAALIPNPNDPTQAIINLGANFQNLAVLGASPETSTRIDVGATIRPGLITGTRNNLAAEDTGFINFNDRGVDLLWTHDGAPEEIGSGGGVVTITNNLDIYRPDYAYTAHSLTLPSGALVNPVTFNFQRPQQSTGDLGLRNAVRITETSPSPLTFAQPVTLTLQYRTEDLNVTPGGVEPLFRVYQVLPPGGKDLKVGPTRNLPGGQQLRLVPGAQTIDTATNTVQVTLDGQQPGAGGNEIGIFATIPINPVESRTINIAPSSGDQGRDQAAVTFLAGGTGGAYTMHRVEFPGFSTVAPGTPGSVQVTIRSASLFERSFAGSEMAQTFPNQSGAVFVVETKDSAGNPIPFSAAANVRVQYFPRANPADTDVCDFSGVAGLPARMRMVQTGFDDEAGVNFQFLDLPQAVDTAQGTVTAESIPNLTGPNGIGIYGAVIDNRVTPVNTARILSSLLGEASLSQAERSGADRNANGRIDVGDLVMSVNQP